MHAKDSHYHKLKKPILKYLFAIIFFVACLFGGERAQAQVTMTLISNSSINPQIIRNAAVNAAPTLAFDIHVGATLPTTIKGIRFTLTALTGGSSFSSGEPVSAVALSKSNTGSPIYTAGSVSSVGGVSANFNSGLGISISGGLTLTANSDNYFFVFLTASTNVNATNFSSATVSLSNSLYTDANFNSGTNVSGAVYTAGTVPLYVARNLYWSGNSNNLWSNQSNWTPTINGTNPASIPLPGDIVYIGTGAQTYLVQPTIDVAAFAGTLNLGCSLNTTGTTKTPPTLTLNFPLTVATSINTASNFTGTAPQITIQGSSNVSAASLNVGDGTNIPTSTGQCGLVIGLTGTNSTFTVAGDVTFKSTVYTAGFGPANLSINGGNLICDRVVTNNSAGTGGRSSLFLSTGTLTLNNSTPFSLYAGGTNYIAISTGTTVNYAGANQTVYVDLPEVGGPNPHHYGNVILSGSGTLLPDAVGSFLVDGNLSTSGSGSPTLDLTTKNVPVTVLGGLTNVSGATIKPGAGAFSVTGSVSNTGTITASTGAVTTGAVTNTGTITASGVITTGAFTQTAGTFTGGTGAISMGAIKLTGGSFILNNGSETASSLAVTSPAIFKQNGTGNFESFASTTLNSGSITGGTGTFTSDDILTINGGTFTGGTGAISLAAGFDVYGGAFITATGGTGLGNFTDASFIRLNGGTETVTFGSGTILLKQALTLNGGTLTFGSGAASVTNNVQMSPLTGGVFNCGSGSLTIGTAFSLAAGSLNGPPSGGSLQIKGDFTNTATYNTANPGVFNPGLGTVTFNGAYTNSAKFTYSAGTIIFSNSAASQTITDNSTLSNTIFNNVKFTSTATTKPINLAVGSAGKFSVASTGLLTLTNASTVLSAGAGLLTLNSDVSGAANVDIIPSGASITGTVNVQRYLTGGIANSRGYRLLSSPISVSSSSLILPNLNYINNYSFTSGTNGTGNGFTAPTSGGPTLYFYRENIAPSTASFTAGTFRGVSNINNGSTFSFDGGLDADATLPAGNGFMFFFRGPTSTSNPYSSSTLAQAATFSSAGYLNQGDIVVQDWFKPVATPTTTYLSFTNIVGINNTVIRGYNLVGNPYPSSIDWDKVSAANTGVGTKIYIYNPDLKTYATYVAGALPGNNFNGTGNATANIIPSGQGFFVTVANATTQLIFHEANKSTGQVASSNLSLATAAANPAADPKYLSIELFKDSLTREDALVFFKPEAKPAYVYNEDAEYLKGNSAVNLATRSSDNIALAINQMNFPKASQVIPLNINMTAAGNYQIKMLTAKNIPAAYDVWLMDAYKKDSLDLKNNPVYTFEANTDTNTYGNNRFKLVIRQNAALTVHLLSFDAVKSTNDVKLNWTTENEADYTGYVVERSTDGGKTFKVLDSLTSAGLGTYNDLDPSPVLGTNLYRLKQTDVAGNASYSNIVNIMYANVLNTVLTNSNISVYPNPAQSTLNLAVTNTNNTDLVAAAYKITIVNSSGMLVKTATTTSSSWQAQIDNLTPGTYFIQVINTNNNTLTGKSTFVKL